MSSYIYRDSNDTKRVNIFKRETDLGSEWDIDFWDRLTGDVVTFSVEFGDLFDTRKEAKQEAEREIGKLTSICPKNTVTEGWN